MFSNGGNVSVGQSPQSAVNSYDVKDSDILFRTSDRGEYERRVLQAKQGYALGKQWRRAQLDITNKNYSSLNEVKMMYMDADLMDNFPEIGTALDIASEEACVSHDTPIKLLNGNIKTIGELYETKANNFWVYAVDSEGHCKPSLVESVSFKGVKPVYRIILNDGTTIKCTHDHMFMLSDCTWKNADDLVVGDSLMSIYEKIDYKGYERIKSSIESKLHPTHRIVAENVLRTDKLRLANNNPNKQRIVIHHSSFNKRNNDPSKLVYMFWDEHQKLHTDLNRKRWENEEFVAKMRRIFSETAKKTRTKYGKELSQRMVDGLARYRATLTQEELNKKYGNKGSKNGMYGTHRTGALNPHFNPNYNHIEDIPEDEYISFLITCPTPFCRDMLAEHFNMQKSTVIDYNQKLCKKYKLSRATQLGYIFDPSKNMTKFRELVQQGITSPSVLAKSLGIHGYSKKRMNLYAQINGYADFEDALSSVNNHRIISIEKDCEPEKVYDLINSSTNNCYAIKCHDGHIISHNCYVSREGKMVNVTSKSERIKSVLEDLLQNRLSINITLPMVCRAMCKYGNDFMLLNITEDNGVVGWKRLPVYEIERYENGMRNPYMVANTNVDSDKELSTNFVWVGSSDFSVFKSWQIAHFRLLYDSIYLPYGVSFLNKARRHWRILSMQEDMMLIYRLERSIERRVFKINVGAIDEDDVPAYIDEVANSFKRTPIIDPMTGQVDLKKNLLNVAEDFFVPVRDDNASNPIETLSGAQNMTAMDDIKFIQNKVVTALRVPKSFLNFEDDKGDGKNLSLLDVRFQRTVNRIQQYLLMELNKICIIHLYLLGFTDDLTNFSLSMNNPSTQTEMLEIENLAKRISTAKDATTGGSDDGLPLYSMMRAWREILGWSDKEIEDNLEEMRLERALAAELAKTTEIISKTGVFDAVDNIYGDPGAEYSKGQPGEEGGVPGGGGGGGGLGGLAVGGGEFDFGDDGEGPEEETGAEGEMNMGDAADEDAGAGPDNGGAESSTDEGTDETQQPTIGEAILKRMEKKVIDERKRLAADFATKRAHYEKALVERIEKRRKEREGLVASIPLYDKNFLVNEELNNVTNELTRLVRKD